METYGKKACEAILRDYCSEWAIVEEAGVILNERLYEYGLTQELHWKYACELEGPGAPDPLEAPCLPIPFNANQLAAFMLDGIGAAVASNYGNWEHGPDEKMLDTMDILATKAKDALRNAYKAIREAERVVGKYPRALQRKKDRTSDSFGENLENVISRQENLERREPAVANTVKLKLQSERATRKYHAAFSVWRKLMVNHLLPSQAPVTRIHVDPIEVGPKVSLEVPKQRAQEARILELLKAQGLDPLRLPARVPSKPGSKASTKKLALEEPKYFTDKTFEFAWQRLRDSGEIAGGK